VHATSRSRRLLVFLAAALVLGCDGKPVMEVEEVGETPPEADIVVPDLKGDIVFGFGQTVYVESERLWIEFTDVLGDSRCPKDACCFWPGRAEIELALRKSGVKEDFAVLVLQPGGNPRQDPEIYECACGYRIYFLALEPYPTAGGTIPEESYIAQIAIEPDPGCCPEGEVCFTWVNPFLLQRDIFVLDDVSIDGDELTIDVGYAGGCREHGFKLYMQPVFAESNPVRAHLYLSHDGDGDVCEAWIRGKLTFDVREIAELYFEQYGSYGDIILDVFGYFTDQPGEGIEVTYSL